MAMDEHAHHQHHLPDADTFNQAITGLPPANPTEIIDLADGDTFDLTAAPVRKRIGDSEVRLLAYNGSIPGPTLRVRQGMRVNVNFRNQIDLESTVHWHGIRLDNRFDGTRDTQAPVQIGGQFTYQLTFPDPGIYWYHPHIREDYGQEMGLYGNVLVVPEQQDYWSPVHREVVLTLDDILMEDGRIAPFSPTETTHTAMGRFGNVMLVSGETEFRRSVNRGEVVRFYLTNTANTRVFNVALNGARMKLVGGDSGRCERQELVDSVMLAPSERAIVDVLFDEPGSVALEHRTPSRTYALGSITVAEERATPDLGGEFTTLRSAPELALERERMPQYLQAAPDKSLAFVARMDLDHDVDEDETTTYACPMHPEVVSDEPGSCPKCGMKLLPVGVVEPAVQEHGHSKPMEHDAISQGHHEHHHAGHHHAGGAHEGIEWEDEMEAVNRMTTPANMRWLLVDRETDRESHAIHWKFQVGDRVKIRLVNELESDHPMQHPFHIHGAGRFLILSRDGEPESNLMWKDTVLVRTGQTVDILLDVTNPGIWMAHCHIAEHHEGGMMFSFEVTE